LDITHKVVMANSVGDAFTIIEAGIPPGEMIPPHIHTREDECTVVLEGELTFDVGSEIVVAPVGSYVHNRAMWCPTPCATQAQCLIDAWSVIHQASSRTTTTSMSRSSRAP
jgi:cupin domain